MTRVSRVKRTKDRPLPTPSAGPVADRSRRPKIQDVALLAEVSLGTVSAVLNGNGRVSEATRDRVRTAIAHLGYRPDLYASNLARRQTQLFGLIVSSLQNPFFAEVAQAIEDIAAAHDFQVSLMATNFSPERHRAAVKQLLGARIAGLAVMTSEYDEVSHQLVQASGVPSVFLDTGEPTESSSLIRVDSRAGMQAAVEHLIAFGHRDLLYLRNSQQASGPSLLSHRLRDEGFAAAVRACAVRGLRTTIVEVQGGDPEAGEHAIDSALGSIPFTAVIAVTDMIGMGVYRGLQARKIRIPEDVSVVGFDNTFFSRFLNPPLTTVDIPRETLGRMVVHALLRTGEDARRPLDVPTRLILRDSTAPPRAPNVRHGRHASDRGA